MYSLVQVGFNKDGRLQAVDITMYANDGYLSEYGWAVSSVIIFMMSVTLQRAVSIFTFSKIFSIFAIFCVSVIVIFEYD